jgi:hypothetical protein
MPISRNVKTALLLGAVALTTFTLIILKYWVINAR